MDDKQNSSSEQKKEKTTPLWQIILFWLSVAAVFWVAQKFEDSSRGSGRTFLLWCFGLAALGIFLNIIWGSSMRETWSNFKGITRAILLFFLAVMVIGGIGNCMGGGGGLPDNIRF